MSTRTANATASIPNDSPERARERTRVSSLLTSRNRKTSSYGKMAAKNQHSRSRARFSAAPCSSYRSKETSIVRLSSMQIPKSGSLTSKNRGIISLTPEDLRNHSFAVFTINCKCAVEFFGAQRCSYRHFFCTSSFMP